MSGKKGATQIQAILQSAFRTCKDFLWISNLRYKKKSQILRKYDAVMEKFVKMKEVLHYVAGM